MEGSEVAVLLLFVVLIAFAVRGYLARPSEPSDVFVSVPPRRCLEQAAVLMAERGFSLAASTERSLTFTRPKKANTDIGCLLLLLGVVPGLLYFGLYKGTQSTTLVAVPEGGGSRLIVTGDDKEGRRYLSSGMTMAASS